MRGQNILKWTKHEFDDSPRMEIIYLPNVFTPSLNDFDDNNRSKAFVFHTLKERGNYSESHYKTICQEEPHAPQTDLKYFPLGKG